MPGNPIFAKLFGHSPMSSMHEHMVIANDCCSLLPRFFQTVKAGDWDQATELRQQVVALEKQADDMKRELRLGLPRSVFLPVQRSDLLELLHMQDRIPNRTKDITGMVMGRKMQIPLNLEATFDTFIDESVSASAIALRALGELDGLIDSGYSGKEIETVEDMLQSLSDVEHGCDLSQVAVEQALFAIEKELDPIDVMFLYRIISWVGELADDAQAVGNRMLYLISR